MTRRSSRLLMFVVARFWVDRGSIHPSSSTTTETMSDGLCGVIILESEGGRLQWSIYSLVHLLRAPSLAGGLDYLALMGSMHNKHYLAWNESNKMGFQVEPR